MTLNGHFTLNFVFFLVKLKFKIYAMISMEYGHISACWKFISPIFYVYLFIYGLYHQVKLTFQRTQAYTAYSTFKRLNEILTAYDYLLILIDCGIERFTACDSRRVSCLLFHKNNLITQHRENLIC